MVNILDMVQLKSLIAPTLLFVMLSPGVFLKVPPNENENEWSGFMLGDTDPIPVLVHALIFAIILYTVKMLPRMFEGRTLA